MTTPTTPSMSPAAVLRLRRGSLGFRTAGTIALFALVAGAEACGSSGTGTDVSGNGGNPGASSGSTGGGMPSGNGAGSSSGASGSSSGGGSAASSGSGSSGGGSSGSSGGSSSGSGGGSGSGSSGAGGVGSSSGSGSGGSSSGGGTYVCTPGLPSSIADLQSKVDPSSSTKSSVTPMGVHYETPAQHVVTSAEQALLNDASQEPSTVFSGAEWHKLTVTLYPAPDGKPEPADINQHDIGNCDGDSALASLAYQNPVFIQSLITDNKDGTYGVKMFDPMGKPMTVNVDSQFMMESGGTNLGQVSCKNNTACWSTVLEKAYIKYNQVYGVVSDVNGIGSEHTTPMFTGVGDSFAFNAGALSPADITRAVTAFLAAGKFITTGFNMDGVVLPAGGTPAGAQSVTAHGYAGLVPATSAFMMAARNPWGLVPDPNYDSSTDGVMNIPPDASWASMMDFRIIEPGAACGPGQTAPYVPKQLDPRGYVSNIHEPHAHRR